jgi:hypothetical protein
VSSETTIQPAVLNSEEAAAYLNRTVRFVQRVLRYEVPVVQHGERKALYFYKHDLDMWLVRNTQQPVR